MWKKRRGVRFNIGRKLLIFFLVLSISPLIIGGYISYTITVNQLGKSIKAHLSDLARDCGRKISFYVSSHYQDIKLLSKAHVLEGSDTHAKQKYIEDSMKAYSFYRAITVIDLAGTITACTGEELIGDSKADREWFHRTAQNKQYDVVPLDAYRAETAGWEMVIGFNVPIMDESKKEVTGVLTTRISMNHIIERVRILEERIEGAICACLINRRGEMLAGPDERKFLTTHPLIEFPVVMDLLTAGETGIIEYKNDTGEDLISARYALEGHGDFDGWGWGIIVTVPVKGAFKAAYRIRSIIIILVLGMALFAAVLSVYISKRISMPITEVAESAQRISKGDLKPVRIKYDPRDEIGDLVSAFNKMTEDLHETTVSRDSLAKEITERRKAEQRVKRLNTVLRTICNVNQLIAFERDRNRLLQGVCDSLIKTLGYHSAWIAMLDESGALSALGESGLGDKFLPMIEQLKRGELTGLCARALGQPGVLVSEDLQSTCANCPLRDKYGGRGAMTVRLEHSGKIYGILSASIPANYETEAEELSLFKEVAGDIALALNSIELEDERKRTAKALKKARDELEMRVKERTADLTVLNTKLLKEIVERKRMEGQLKESIKEKEILINEIHHRVKNNLQIISSLLDMSSLRIHDLQAINFITDARTKIHTMAFIYSQLYQSERFDQVDMGKNIRELISYLSDIFAEKERITPVIEISGVYLSITQAIPCALVVNELISNAFKHAFKKGQKGIIKVSMHKPDDNTLIARVEDNGMGMPEDVDIYNTDSLGLKLVRNLVQRQLKGKIEVKRNKGTCFIIEFKIIREEIKYA